LENEDRRIVELGEELAETKGPGVIERADYGAMAKRLIRHMATREAAAEDVVVGLSALDGTDELVSRFVGDQAARRRHLDTVETMSRGVQGIDLNTGQDFDGELQALLAEVGPQLRWELDSGIPAVRGRADLAALESRLHDADYVAKHAPTHLDPDGPRWWERAPVVSRLVTVVHHLRDYPSSTRDART
jgi:hypothetical protein